jgi:hypothetical protein
MACCLRAWQNAVPWLICEGPLHHYCGLGIPGGVGLPWGCSGKAREIMRCMVKFCCVSDVVMQCGVRGVLTLLLKCFIKHLGGCTIRCNGCIRVGRCGVASYGDDA